MLTKPESCYVLHNTCGTLVLRTADALTTTNCAQWTALFGILPSGSCPLDLKCLYSRQGCVSEIQHFDVSQQSFLWRCLKMNKTGYLLWHGEWNSPLKCVTKWTDGVWLWAEMQSPLHSADRLQDLQSLLLHEAYHLPAPSTKTKSRCSLEDSSLWDDATQWNLDFMLPEFMFVHPTQLLQYIFTLIINWQVAVMWSYFNWKLGARGGMPSGHNSHFLCCLCVTVTNFMCCELWSDTAQLQAMVHCCSMVARPVLPAQPFSCTVHYNNDIHRTNTQRH
jgi:hypothetical protein